LITKLLRQGAHYASGSLLISIASLISFPILTRLLPMNEYGVLSLLTSFLGLLVALSKMGLQQSVLRYHKKNSLGFDSSLLCLIIIVISIVNVVLQIGNYFFSYQLVTDYFQLLCFIASLQAFKSIVLNCYVAEQRSVWVNIFNVIHKYLLLITMLYCVFFIDNKAISVLYSMLVADAFVTLFLTIIWIRKIHFFKIDVRLIKRLVYYGAPLMIVEFLQISHAFIDRFLIEYFLGPEQVAAYVAPYSIADIISGVIFGAIATALVPIYMGLWKENKKKEVSIFLTEVSNYFLLFFPIIITGSYLVSVPLMTLLASEKYSDSAFIMPITLAGIAIFSSTFIYSAGLRLKSSQASVVIYVFESLVINFLLNYLFINKYGILASAWSTVVSYLWMSFRYYNASSKILNIDINLGYFLKGLFLSVFIYLFIDGVVGDLDPLAGLLSIGVLFILMVLVSLFLTDEKVRSSILIMIKGGL
jgi:O-antigen/teichoic acid export membrane protein